MPLKKSRQWSYDEIEYLKASWGYRHMKYIAARLGRSENAIKNKVFRLGLGAARANNCDYITLHFLIHEMLGAQNTCSSYALSVKWPKMLKIYMKPMPVQKVKCVKLSEFWEFAEKNRNLFDFSQLEKYALGLEPDWVDEQRKLDQKKRMRVRGNYVSWTTLEEQRLKVLSTNKKLTIKAIAHELNRSEGSVSRKLYDLGLSQETVRNACKNYRQQELNLIKDLIIKGYSYTLISEKTGRSEKSLRGMIYQRLKTENLNKVRKYLLDGYVLEERKKTLFTKKDGANYD